jgi:hypothetical protein
MHLHYGEKCVKPATTRWPIVKLSESERDLLTFLLAERNATEFRSHRPSA